MLKKINQVICGDSRKVLQRLEKQSVNLIYIDPPFFANRVLEAKGKYGKINSFSDKWSNNLESYLEFMVRVLNECDRVLKKTGSLYLHCDWHSSHYLKVELDKIFGRKNFRNEIVWKRHNSHNNSGQGSKIFERIHDVILFYTKTDDYTWNPMYLPYSEEYVEKFYRHVEQETGRRFALGDLSGPGGKSNGNPHYKFMGITRYWRYKKTRMERLYKEGRIVQRRKGTVPLQKRYLDEMQGISLHDVWDEIKSVQVTKKESVGYPTQKPERLLERIIQISSNERDLVLDCFSGSGTSLVASKNLGRNYIGIDSNADACKIARKRIKSRVISEPEMVYPVLP